MMTVLHQLSTRHWSHDNSGPGKQMSSKSACHSHLSLFTLFLAWRMLMSESDIFLFIISVRPSSALCLGGTVCA